MLELRAKGVQPGLAAILVGSRPASQTYVRNKIKACRDLGLKHLRTRPYTPKTNGKAERFILTALREWAYAVA